MSVSVVPLELEMFHTLPPHTRRCVFWEMVQGDGALDPAATVSRETLESEFDKEAWISGVLLEWGTCGQIAVEPTSGRIVGSALYAPPGRVPRSRRFPSGPVSSDAVLLTSVRAEPGFEDALPAIMDGVVGDIVRRGVRAIEAFGFTGSREPLELDLVGLMLGSGITTDVCQLCLMPTDFLLDSGFEIVTQDLYLPRLRLELDEGLGWKSAVERALEKLVHEAALDLASPTPSAVC
ncbi:hypothetical protein nbrc107696_10890 [Gordonia spumicola]|uniref:GNAT family N-acetyltransferase n=1 Tax=Gordonia spumicola TaxID=589161 RepID=A0A7I9V6C0_9ACTN|nr:hypothetical protein [Gordonia spumicola]GEE00643.1 hypothetical protein nbrc107696_10890 [Gordonia spumicola]